MSERYNEEDKEFEDYVKAALWNDGVAIYTHSSRTKQLYEGEGSSVEMKHDRKWRETGNFYIETAERPRGTSAFRPSGIHRGDKTWLWACKKAEANHLGDTPTRGFLLPVTWAALSCCRQYHNGRPKVNNK